MFIMFIIFLFLSLAAHLTTKSFEHAVSFSTDFLLCLIVPYSYFLFFQISTMFSLSLGLILHPLSLGQVLHSKFSGHLAPLLCSRYLRCNFTFICISPLWMDVSTPDGRKHICFHSAPSSVPSIQKKVDPDWIKVEKTFLNVRHFGNIFKVF